MKSYYNDTIQKEIQSRGFCVYPYLSMQELAQTVNKDYLTLLSWINIPLAILSIILTVLNVFLWIIFLLGVYAVIELYLLLRLLHRSYYYVIGRNVLFTHKGIILGKLSISIDTPDHPLIHTYESLFHETLGQANQIKDIIQAKKKKLIDGSMSGGSKLFSFLWNLEGRDSAQFAILVSVAVLVYGIFLYLFYYLGYGLGYVFFLIYSVFLKMYLSFTKNKEYEIKQKAEELDESFDRLSQTATEIKTKISEFQWWEIGNLAGFAEKKFTLFSNYILASLKQKDELLAMLQKYEYHDFIDFVTLKRYIKTNFNAPLESMISLLDDLEKKLVGNVTDLQALSPKEVEYSANLDQKSVVMTRQLELIRTQNANFKQMILT